MRSGSSSPTSRARDTVDSGRMKARDHPYAFTSSFRERRLGPSPPSSHLPPVPLFPLLSLSPHNSLCPSPLHSISLSLSLSTSPPSRRSWVSSLMQPGESLPLLASAARSRSASALKSPFTAQHSHWNPGVCRFLIRPFQRLAVSSLAEGVVINYEMNCFDFDFRENTETLATKQKNKKEGKWWLTSNQRWRQKSIGLLRKDYCLLFSPVKDQFIR